MTKLQLTLVCISFVFVTSAQLPIDTLNVSLNPFQKRTQAVYYLANSDTSTLYIFNLLGQNVLTVYSNILKPSGHYQDSIIMDNFPDGVYLLSLKTKHASTGKKIIKTPTSKILEVSDLNEQKIYPSPFTNKIFINLESQAEAETSLIITSALGQLVYQQNNLTEKSEVDVGFLQNGVYHVRLFNSKIQQVYTLVKE